MSNTNVTSMTPFSQDLTTTSQYLNLPANFPVAFTSEEKAVLEKDIAKTDFRNIPMSDIALLASEAETSLHRTLGNFLARIEKNDQPKVFTLVERLKQEVEAENLPDLAHRILNAKPTFGERMIGLFSRKALSKATTRAYEDVRLLASGKSKKLSDVIATMEAELRADQQRLGNEIRSMEQLKNEYRERFVEFARACAFMNGFVQKARVEVQAMETQENVDVGLLQDARDKLQALESRALAIEGTMTRLPADQLVIRQLQNAGISTLQETTTTASGRFASIKMTLVTIHGALITQGVQRTAQAGAALDANLLGVRQQLMTEVVTNAANAPGENRKQQADQLVKINAETQELYNLVQQARVKNQQQFAEASNVFAQVRKAQQELGMKIRPDLPIA